MVDFSPYEVDASGASMTVYDGEAPIAAIYGHRGGEGTFIEYLGYLNPETGEKMRPGPDDVEIDYMRQKYPGLGIKLMRWARSNLEPPYFAAFANQELRRVLKAEPTGMTIPTDTELGDVSIDRLRVSSAGLIKGIDRAVSFFDSGDFSSAASILRDMIRSIVDSNPHLFTKGKEIWEDLLWSIENQDRQTFSVSIRDMRDFLSERDTDDLVWKTQLDFS